MKEAIAEMKALVTHRYPTAQCSMDEGEAPIGIYLLATVDADDLDEVVDLFLERMVELQVEEALPLLVIPERTPERPLPSWCARRRTESRLSFPELARDAQNQQPRPRQSSLFQKRNIVSLGLSHTECR